MALERPGRVRSDGESAQNNEQEALVPVTAPNVTLIPSAALDGSMAVFETGLLDFLRGHGLPTDGILVAPDQRLRVIRNLGDALDLLNARQRAEAPYIAKFLAAVAAGLFDAALNYLWDETVNQLRQRVAAYDLDYFFDTIAPTEERRKKLQAVEDLARIDDSELIEGVRKIGLLGELGYRQLDHIRYLRNWASAAHPNQHSLTGLQLIGYLETCIKEVIAVPLSRGALQVQQLLANLKTNSLTTVSARELAPALADLRAAEADRLAAGCFGLYVRPGTTAQTRRNIQLLMPHLWGAVTESTRAEFGLRYGSFLASGDLARKDLAAEFLETVDGQSYLPDDTRAAALAEALDQLLAAHRAWGNYYSEPPHARELQRLVGAAGRIPAAVRERYVLSLVEVFLTNGNGVAHNADPIYRSLIGAFDPTQARVAVCSFIDDTIASRLQFRLPQAQFRELLGLLRPTIPAAGQELVDVLAAYTGPLEHLRDDNSVMRQVRHLQAILG